MREPARLFILLCSALFVGASLTTVALLVRAEWARRPNGRRRPTRTRTRHQIWPDPAGITPAGRPFERLARRTALVAVLALACALFALGLLHSAAG